VRLEVSAGTISVRDLEHEECPPAPSQRILQLDLRRQSGIHEPPKQRHGAHRRGREDTVVRGLPRCR
jgi:hypothetical protein